MPAEKLDHLADQPTKAPTRKLVAGASTGGAAIVVLWVARQLGLDVPAEVGEVLVLAAGSAAAWLKRNAPALVDCLDDDPGRHAVERDPDGDGVVDREAGPIP